MPKVTQKGQVTIPRPIRSLLNINTGDEVVFQVDNGKILIKKKKASIQNIRRYTGFLSHLSGKKTEDIITELRGDTNDLGS